MILVRGFGFGFGFRFLFKYSPPPPTPLLGIHTYRFFVINPDPDPEPFHSARSGFLRLIRLRLLPVSLDPLQLCLFAHCSLFTVRCSPFAAHHLNTQTHRYRHTRSLKSTLSLSAFCSPSRPFSYWPGSGHSPSFVSFSSSYSFPFLFFPYVRSLVSYLFRRSAGFSISFRRLYYNSHLTPHTVYPAVLPYFLVLPSFHPPGLPVSCSVVLPFSCSHSPVLPLVLSLSLSCPPITVTTLSCPHCTHCTHPSQSSFS